MRIICCPTRNIVRRNANIVSVSRIVSGRHLILEGIQIEQCPPPNPDSIMDP
ncbi:hypothetical protein P691DRAFT_808012 [Macrolepiota fuliginosa MF-IS2]|uniref:Uncharacterized protein n=1 Tax=Macrolepiota fuliginosa MF-IS2 TaxID=1400762 RepID=A0A9P6C047_9AGAR|nr:hypothetical protein P691DRAFT_808012 [Macrolepiota fuliginosa MF-IS2]